MTLLNETLAALAPGITYNRDLGERYNPRWGLAIYSLPIPGYSPASPGVVLGEAMAARSNLGCTLLEGIPKKVPAGAVVLGQYNALKAMRPDLLADVPELHDQGQYAIRIGKSCVVTSPSREGLASGMQTLAMIILRHNEDTIPGSLIVDAPLCHVRSLAVEVATGEISLNLLMQMLSFAATFKANRLHVILGDDFDPARPQPSLEPFIQACRSYGIEVGVRLPWLDALLSGRKTLLEAWTGIRATARLFGAEQAALDDPCPAVVDPGRAKRIAASIMNGEAGTRNFSVDARLLAKAGCSGAGLRAVGVTGWHRLWETDALPGPELADLPVQADVQSPLPGFSNRTATGYRYRLDAALKWLRDQPRRELMVSFRGIGVSHMWQNMLFPAATGLIAGWGVPVEAEKSARLFSNLLYGESAGTVMNMWDAISAAFPPGLSPAEEILVRRTAFGRWPESADELALLSGIDWLETAKRIQSAVESLKAAAAGLTRNASTLSGARLALYALSWLHCFLALTPEMESRKREDFLEDSRTPAIASELLNNFRNWRQHLQNLVNESGLEIAEGAQLDGMGRRLSELCEGMME